MKTTKIACLSLLALASSAIAQAPDMVLAKDAINHVGDYAMVCGVIAAADYRQDIRGTPTYLNFTKPYPNAEFTVVIWGRERDNFEDVVLQDLDGYKACAYGKVETYRGRPQMTISQPEQLNYKAPD